MREQYKQDAFTRKETLSTEINNPLPELKFTILKTETIKQMLTQVDKMNLELIKKIMAGIMTALPSLRNRDWKEVLKGTEKLNELLPNILTDKITKLNELVSAEDKTVSDKNQFIRRNI